MSDRIPVQLVTKSLFEDSRPAGGGVSNTGLFICSMVIQITLGNGLQGYLENGSLLL